MEIVLGAHLDALIVQIQAHVFSVKKNIIPSGQVVGLVPKAVKHVHLLLVLVTHVQVVLTNTT